LVVWPLQQIKQSLDPSSQDGVSLAVHANTDDRAADRLARETIIDGDPESG
jgi:hypothetical protein